MSNTLFLWLEGPLQSWGEQARWSVRDTASAPTKSGVVGLLCCALGISDDEAIRQLSQRIDIGVRYDRPGQRLVDFLTVSGGVLSARGKVKLNPITHQPERVISWRTYLCDAAFLVAVRTRERDGSQAEGALIKRLAVAIQSPHWPIFLGRKSCPPSVPVYSGEGQFIDILTALESRAWSRNSVRNEGDSDVKRLRVTVPAMAPSGIRRRDEIDLRSRRTYLPRYTLDATVEVPIQYAEVGK